VSRAATIPPGPQRRLAHELVRGGIDPPGRTSIYRALVRNGLIEPKARRRRKADYRRWERSRSMQLWQLDVMGGVWLADGRECKLVSGVDDHSRSCVAAGLVERANARAVCRVFTQAPGRYGVPEELLTDNGKVFTGRLGPHPGEVLFDRVCRGYGTTHLLTGVRTPTTTGKVERFHKTLRPRAVDRPALPVAALAQQAVDDWVEDYDTRRPHQGIAMLVPAQRFRPATRPAPEPAPALPAQPALPMPASSPTEVTRRVTTSGLVCVCYQQVSAGRHLAGQVVTVRLQPTVLQVFFAGQLVRTVPRRSTKEVVQLQAHRPHRPTQRPTS
jgi:transposase InsO family protein